MESSKKAYHLILTYSYGAGFFSVFNKLFGYLQRFQPVYAVSWYVMNPSNAYGEGEIFSKVFTPYVNLEYKDYEIQPVVCTKYIDGTLTGREACRLYTREGCEKYNIPLDWRKQMNNLFLKYYLIHNQSILTKYQEFLQRIYMYKQEQKKIITFLLRHPALNVEQENNVLPSYEMYDHEILKVSGGDLSKSVLVCLTDSQEAFEYFTEKYKNYTILFPDVERVRANEIDSTYRPGGDEKIEIAMLSVLYLTAGDHFIHPVSNMATAVLIINPNIEHSYLVGH